MTEEEYKQQLHKNSIEAEKLYKKLQKYYGKVSVFESDMVEIQDLAKVNKNDIAGLTEAQILEKLHEK